MTSGCGAVQELLSQRDARTMMIDTRDFAGEGGADATLWLEGLRSDIQILDNAPGIWRKQRNK